MSAQKEETTIMTIKELGDSWENKDHRLRNPKLARYSQYGRDMYDGHKFPPILLGEAPDPKTGKLVRMIIDGNNRLAAYRWALSPDNQAAYLKQVATVKDEKERAEAEKRVASVVASIQKGVPYTIKQYDTLAQAMGEELTLNKGRGEEVSEEDRDTFIRRMVKDLGQSVREVAKLVNLHYSSVARIAEGKQNKTGTKKGGRKSGSAARAIEALKPAAFLRALKAVTLTVEKDPSGTDLIPVLKKDKDGMKVLHALPEIADTIRDFAENLEDMLAGKGKHKGKGKEAVAA